MADRLAPPPGLPGAEIEEPVRLPEMSSVSGAIRSALDSIRWDDRHRRLRRHPLLAGCSKTEIRRVVKAGDEIVVADGEMIAHEDTIGYWFFLVLDGEVRLTRRNRAVAALGPGDHAGAVAILGFGPQPTTARTTRPSRLFVIGRRDFISLAYNIPALQARLFPGVPPDRFIEHVRSLWIESDLAWRRLQRRREQTVARSREEALRFFRPPGSEGSFARLAGRAFRSSPESPAMPTLPPPVSRRTRVLLILATTLGITSVAAAGLTLYHPPVVVVTPGRAIDVSDDIVVTGARVERPTGKYLLTPVRYDQPSLLGAAVAVVTGQTTVPLDKPTSDDSLASVRAGEARFRSSQKAAGDLVVRAAGLDPASVQVSFRSRALQGTSAGLVYALALADMLDPGDLSGGRAVAVTGTLDSDGRIQPVAFVWIKADAARRGGATIFLVPPGQAPLATTSGADVREVGSLDEALANLRQ